MLCPRCNTENREDATFCRNCGAELILVCRQCGRQLPPDTKFCDRCGVRVGALEPAARMPALDAAARRLQRLVPKEFAERLLATRGQVAKERRMVTILFSDVKGSTAMAEDLDPEDWMEIMDGAFDVLIGPIYRYEGTLVRLMGDAVLAFFGAPIAHEDDAERACRAALEIIQGAKAYAARLEEERSIHGFNVRVGIHTGLVVVGEVGSDLRVEYTAMGDAVNVAARMESAAEPGTVLISEETHKLIVSLFETEALGRIQVKGKTEPISVHRVLTPKAVAAKPRGVAGLESPLVGRQAELGALRGAIERLRAGVGGVVTVVGEAGIGKSRLVADLRETAAAADLQWVEGRCLSYGTSIAYLLWLDVLRGLLGLTAEAPPAAVRDALPQRVQSLCPERFEIVYPHLGRLLSLPQEAEYEAALRDLEGEQLKAHAFRAVETLIECAALAHPLVLVCEDLHWADATSIELLERLLALTDRAPLLFMCVFRPEAGHGSWRIRETAGRRYPHRHTDLWLEPLSAGDSEMLVDNLLRVEGWRPGLAEGPGLSADGASVAEGLPRKLKWRILSHAEGNPFYVEEIIRSLIDSGAIVQDEDSDRWQAAQEAADIPIPDTLHGVLMARIDRLPEEAKRVLQMAAVIGRIFFYRVLAAIAQEERALDAHLLTLQREQMIRERARLPELEYIFKHHLTQEAAYSGLLRKERRIFHRRVAGALEQLFPDHVEEQAGRLAYHWEGAGEPDKAIGYLLQAGDRARRLGASLEAIDFYQLALQRLAAPEASGAAIERDRIHERLGDVYLLNLSRHDEALEHYESFLALTKLEEGRARAGRKIAVVHLLCGRSTEAQEHYEAALARLSSLPPCAEASRLHCGFAFLLVSRNRLHEAEEHARAGLEISRRIGDASGLAEASKVMGMMAYYREDLEAACEHFERSLALYRELGDLPRTAQACNNVGDTYRRLGEMDRALEYLDEGLELARRIGDPRDEANLLTTKADLFLDQGEWEAAIAHLERALPLAEESGVAAGIIEVHQILGSAYEGVEQLGVARRHLDVAETLSRDTQHLRFAPRIYLDLARLNAAEGEFDEAQRYVGLAVDAAGPEPSDAFLGLMHRCHGALHGYRSNWDDAVAHLEESLKFLERANLPAEVSKARLSLGMAYASRGEEGDRGRACEQLLAALSIFRQIEAQGYLTQVEAWLGELECRS